MNEFKFKAYLPRSDKFIDLLGYVPNKQNTDIRFWYVDNWGHTQNNQLSVDNIHIMLSTGRLDTHGNTIYTSDIVKIIGECFEWETPVHLSFGRFVVGNYDLSYFDEVEIVGNEAQNFVHARNARIGK